MAESLTEYVARRRVETRAAQGLAVESAPEVIELVAAMLATTSKKVAA